GRMRCKKGWLAAGLVCLACWPVWDVAGHTTNRSRNGVIYLAIEGDSRRRFVVYARPSAYTYGAGYTNVGASGWGIVLESGELYGVLGERNRVRLTPSLFRDDY